MGKSKKYDITALDGLTELFNDAVKEMAEEVLFQIESFYETAIQRFYNDYNPLYYDRTYSTYEGSSGARDLFSPQNIFGGGNNWTARIGIDSSYIHGNPYRAEKNWVFERTFVKGIHGINTKHGWGKPQIKKFRRVKGKKTFEAIYMNNASDITKRNVYYDGAVEIQNREMSNMVPSPKALVSKNFKQLTRKKNMKRMFDEILNNKFG